MGLAQAQSVGPWTPPGAKAASYTTFLAKDNEVALRLELPALEAAKVEAVKRANSEGELKRVQVGIGRATQGRAGASSAALVWQEAGSLSVAKWEVNSPGAKALRVAFAAGGAPAGMELRVTGENDATIYGPFTAKDITAAGDVFWTPTVEGERAIIEVRVPSAARGDVALWIPTVSHFFVSPSDPKADTLAKASQSCEVNLICRSATDPALARAGTAVARMVFSDGTGQYLCTGTVLNNTANNGIPYFATAAHCISTQSEASSLETRWFYDTTTCTGTGTNPAQRTLTGGAALIYADTVSDFTLLKLNDTPPSGVTYAGWNAAALTSNTPLTAIHHPSGDVKKVSLATFGGFGTTSLATGSFSIVNWNSIQTGVTEGGSSGSGIFWNDGTNYLYRGGLLGGPSSCTASSGQLYDYYSRFDRAYTAVAQYLSPTPCSYALSSTGTSIGAAGGSGSIEVGTVGGCTWTPVSGASWISVSGGGSGNGTVTYTVQANAGAARTGTITVGGQAFTITQAAGLSTSADNYTALWLNNGESGWGLDVSHQGDILFATVYTYFTDGQPMWLYGSNVARQPDGSFTGPLFRATGAPFFAQPFSGNSPTQVGTITLRFSSVSAGTLTYTFNGTTVTKSISRFVFGSSVPTCTAALGSRATASNYQDIWWNAGEAGWGIEIAHQGNTIFASLFDYDESGRDVWFYGSSVQRQPDGSFSGDLFRSTGPAFNASPFTGVVSTKVGTITLRFSAGDAGTLTYNVGSTTVTKSITRFTLAGSPTVCN